MVALFTALRDPVKIGSFSAERALTCSVESIRSGTTEAGTFIQTLPTVIQVTCCTRPLCIKVILLFTFGANAVHARETILGANCPLTSARSLIIFRAFRAFKANPPVHAQQTVARIALFTDAAAAIFLAVGEGAGLAGERL